MSSTSLTKNILKGILFIVLFITPLIYTSALYMPYMAGKAYFFRLLIQIALVFWLILLYKDKSYRPNFKNPLVIALLIFILVLIITAFTGIDFRRSFFSNAERSDGIIQYIHWVLYFFMAISVFKTKKDWQIAFSLFISAAIVNSIYGFFHHFPIYSAGKLLVTQDQPQLFGLFGNSSYFGGFLIFAIGFCFLFTLPSFSKKKNLGWLIAGLILLFAIALTLTQTRGAYFGVFLGFVIFVILANFYLLGKFPPIRQTDLLGRSVSSELQQDKQIGKKTIITLNIILFIVLAFLILIFIFQNSHFVKSQPLINRIANVSHTTSVQDRLSEWKAALKGFKDKPIFGWGPENFDAVANKHYDYRIGLYEPWFDRPHNQALQYLAEGGIVLFSAYLFFIGIVLYSIFKIYKKEKILASLILAIYVGYIIQGLILFDALPVFLGLFTLLAFIYFQIEPPSAPAVTSNLSRPKNSSVFYIGVSVLAVLMMISIWFTVFIPFSGNRLIIKAYTAIAYADYYTGEYEKSHVEDYKNLAYEEYEKLQSIFNDIFSFKSPYVYVDARRAIGWEFLKKVLDNKKINDENKEIIISLYKKITPELENWVEYRPVDPQVYYVAGATYRLGFTELGQQDALAKAETILKKSLDYSAARIEYVDELGQIFALENKSDELDKLMKNFVSGLNLDDPYRYLSLGHSYFIQKKYDLAMAEYEKAKELGQQFWQSNRDYYRYIQTAEQLNDWQKVASAGEEYLKNRGDDATTLYNVAVAYYYLGDKAKTKEYFERAVILDPNFEQERKNLEEVGAF